MASSSFAVTPYGSLGSTQSATSVQPYNATGKLNSWQASTGFGSETTSLTTTVVVTSMKEGALSTAQGKERSKAVGTLVKDVVTDVTTTTAKINALMSKHQEIIHKANIKYTDAALDAMDQLVKTKNREIIPIVNDLAAFAKQIGELQNTLLTQALTAERLAMDGKLDIHKKSIDIIFDTAIREMNLLSQSLEILYKQDDHELKKRIAIQNQILQIDEKRLEMYLKVQKFKSEEEERMFHQEIEKLEQERKGQEALFEQELKKTSLDNAKELGLREADRKDKSDQVNAEFAEMKLASDATLATTKMNNETEVKKKEIETKADVEKSKAQTEADVEHHRVQAEKDTKITEAVLDATKPDCVVM